MGLLLPTTLSYSWLGATQGNSGKRGDVWTRRGLLSCVPFTRNYQDSVQLDTHNNTLHITLFSPWKMWYNWQGRRGRRRHFVRWGWRGRHCSDHLVSLCWHGFLHLSLTLFYSPVGRLCRQSLVSSSLTLWSQKGATGLWYTMHALVASMHLRPVSQSHGRKAVVTFFLTYLTACPCCLHCFSQWNTQTGVQMSTNQIIEMSCVSLE